MTRGGRPRSFDDHEVVERARDIFWERGYEATSMRDLGDGVGVLPGSLHAAFGSKHELFLRALRSYADFSARSVETVLDESLVLPALRELIMNVLAAAKAAPGRGCMLGNSATEFVPDDEVVADIVRTGFEELEGAIARALEHGKKSGEIRADVDSSAQAVVLVALMQGLHVLARVQPDPTHLRKAIDAALEGLSQ